jgi:hypothetical protein
MGEGWDVFGRLVGDVFDVDGLRPSRGAVSGQEKLGFRISKARGQGFGAESIASVGSFALAYASVLIIEPVLDLVVLAAAKTMGDTPFFHARLHRAGA